MTEKKVQSHSIQIGCTPELMHMLQQHRLELECVILSEGDQSTPAQMISLVNLCKTGLDILGDEELSRQRESDQVFRRVVAQDFLVSLSDLTDIVEPLRGVEPVKFHHSLNLPPKVQRSEGRQPKHTRARMRGKKK